MEVGKFLQSIVADQGDTPNTMFVSAEHLFAGGSNEGRYYSASAKGDETASFRAATVEGRNMAVTDSGVGFVVGSVAVVLAKDGKVHLNGLEAIKVNI